MRPRPVPRPPRSRAAAIAVALAVVLGLAACDRVPPLPGTAPPVAVMDLDAVAAAVGRDRWVKARVEAAASEAQAQLQADAEKLQAELEQERERYGSQLDEEARRALQGRVTRAQQQIQQARQSAGTRVQQLRQRLLLDFGTEVRPHAEEVARARGAAMVFPARGSHWYDPRVDITAAVIEALRAAGVGAEPEPSE